LFFHFLFFTSGHHAKSVKKISRKDEKNTFGRDLENSNNENVSALF